MSKEILRLTIGICDRPSDDDDDDDNDNDDYHDDDI